MTRMQNYTPNSRFKHRLNLALEFRLLKFMIQKPERLRTICCIRILELLLQLYQVQVLANFFDNIIHIHHLSSLEFVFRLLHE